MATLIEQWEAADAQLDAPKPINAELFFDNSVETRYWKDIWFDRISVAMNQDDNEAAEYAATQWRHWRHA